MMQNQCLQKWERLRSPARVLAGAQGSWAGRDVQGSPNPRRSEEEGPAGGHL